jgi:hypothetical protein
MPKTVDFRLLLLATLFGFLGGALSSIALPQLAFAQDEPADKIVAHEFHVVDGRGNVVGVFGADPGQISQVTSRDGKAVVRVNPEPAQGKIMLFDSNGNTLWSQPRGLVHPLTSGQHR